MKTYTAANGITYTTRIVEYGDKYGLNNCLTHDVAVPMLEFYDHEYQHTPPYGQFISRYYLNTLINHDPQVGLDLAGDVPEWKVDAETLQRILDDALPAQ